MYIDKEIEKLMRLIFKINVLSLITSKITLTILLSTIDTFCIIRRKCRIYEKSSIEHITSTWRHSIQSQYVKLMNQLDTSCSLYLIELYAEVGCHFKKVYRSWCEIYYKLPLVSTLFDNIKILFSVFWTCLPTTCHTLFSFFFLVRFEA